MNPAAPTWAVLGDRDGHDVVVLLDAEATVLTRVDAADVPWTVRALQEAHPRMRWVWDDTARRLPALLRAGVRVSRCHDLRLCHGILRAYGDAAVRASPWDRAAPHVSAERAPALFAWDQTGAAPEGPPSDIESALDEFAQQRRIIARAPRADRLRLLCTAESAGALIAAEMQEAGLPWDVVEHDRLLVEQLGARDAGGALPARLREVADGVRAALGDARMNLDSPGQVLRALHRVGVLAHSTSKWELAEYDHPAIEGLLEYKRLSRLMSANGWAWLTQWVHDGRFRPVYLPAGVVTGRWASAGGGALQIPRRLRPAVRADPGWAMVVADVAQLEPRVLAAMAGDTALAAAARGQDLYAGIVAAGTVATRAEAKVALLGAMYGATTGESGRLVPRLRRAYPRAMALVDDAARTGERGGAVSTWLGRASPAPSDTWQAEQRHAASAASTTSERDRARRTAGDRGRFTRNFVVQGTAAEWALVWLAHVRAGLADLPPVAAPQAAPRSGATFERMPHLAFFLHDELIVHTPARYGDVVAQIVRDAAASAARMLFGGFPLDFPLDLRVGPTAAKD